MNACNIAQARWRGRGRSTSSYTEIGHFNFTRNSAENSKNFMMCSHSERDQDRQTGYSPLGTGTMTGTMGDGIRHYRFADFLSLVPKAVTEAKASTLVDSHNYFVP